MSDNIEKVTLVAAVAFFVVYVVSVLAVFGGVVYCIAHFISKYW